MLIENQGSLFRVMETPEPPSKGFFSSLFSTAASPLDREQLCKYWRKGRMTKLKKSCAAAIVLFFFVFCFLFFGGGGGRS